MFVEKAAFWWKNNNSNVNTCISDTASYKYFSQCSVLHLKSLNLCYRALFFRATARSESAARGTQVKHQEKHPSNKEAKFSKGLKLHISFQRIYCFSRAISSPSSPYEQAIGNDMDKTAPVLEEGTGRWPGVPFWLCFYEYPHFIHGKRRQRAVKGHIQRHEAKLEVELRSLLCGGKQKRGKTTTTTKKEK